MIGIHETAHPAAPAPASPARRPREEELDVLKALAIFGVVWIHGSNLLSSSSRTQILFDTSRFAVPVFVTIWAYFLERSLSRTDAPWAAIRRRFVALLIAYVFWSAAFCVLAGTYRGLSPLTLINGIFLGYGWAGQGFLLLLLQLLPLFPFLRPLITTRRTVVLCVLTVPIFALFGYVLWNVRIVERVDFRPFFYWLPYVFIGVTAARLPGPSRDWRFVPLALMLLCLPAVEGHFLRASGRYHATYVTPATFLATLAILYIFYVGCRGVAAPKMLTFIGQNTFGIYVLNPWFVHFGSAWLHGRFSAKGWPIIDDAVMPALSVGLIVAGCLLVIVTLRRVGLGILLGEWPSPRVSPK
jgi:surface polysaccharide O-acyltransferase-like enzyme